MIHLGIMKGLAEDGKVRVEIPEVGVGYYCIVKVNPEDNFQVGDKLALSKISGSADEFYALGKIDSTFGSTYTVIVALTDLNTVVTDGLYVVFSNTTAASLVNAPEAKAGILRVYHGDTATWLIQTYAVYSPGSGTGNFYSRGYNGTTWSAWRRVITSVDTFGPSGVWGTLDTALTTLDTRLDGLEPRMTAAEGTIVSHTSTIGSHTTSIGTLGTRATALEAEDIALDIRLDAWETWQAATKVWGVTTSPSHYDVPFASITPTDVPGLTVTIPVTSTSAIYVAFVVLDVEVVSTNTEGPPISNKRLEARLHVNGTASTEEINFRTAAAGTPVTGSRSTQSRTYVYTGLASGNRIFKVTCNQHATGPSTQLRVHAGSTIKVIRMA